MFLRNLTATAIVACAVAGQAAAWGDMYMGPSTYSDTVAVHPYNGPNHCSYGLQPVVINGVICCGTPNQSTSYQQMMAHPQPRKVRRVHTHRRTHSHVVRHTHTYEHSH